MAKFAFVLAVLAFCGAGWAVWSVEQDRQKDDREALDAISMRLAAMERTLAELKARLAPESVLEAALPTETSDLATSKGPRLTPPRHARATLEDRLAALEKEMAAARAQEELRTLADNIATGTPAFGQVVAIPGFWPDVAAAASAMKLDSVQASRLGGIVESTQRDLDDLYARPNEEGVKWTDLNQSLKVDASEPGEFMTKMGEHMKKVAQFKAGKVPGANETYGDAVQRIRKDGRERARALLDADQVKVWDRSNPDSLFPGPNGPGTMTFFNVDEAASER